MSYFVFVSIFVLIVVICIAFYCTYVSLIKGRNKVREASSSIGVQLKKRYDLIPNILTIANKFMEHERGLMEEITKLRSQAISLSNSDIAKKIELDGEIKSKMGQLMVAVENYPQLKSDQTMTTAMQTYNEVEEHIAAARRFYNSAVLEFNNKVEIFPSSLVAMILNIKRIEFFTIDESEAAPVDARNYLK